jgi:hypothetical protein
MKFQNFFALYVDSNFLLSTREKSEWIESEQAELCNVKHDRTFEVFMPFSFFF